MWGLTCDESARVLLRALRNLGADRVVAHAHFDTDLTVLGILGFRRLRRLCVLNLQEASL